MTVAEFAVAGQETAWRRAIERHRTSRNIFVSAFGAIPGIGHTDPRLHTDYWPDYEKLFLAEPAAPPIDNLCTALKDLMQIQERARENEDTRPTVMAMGTALVVLKLMSDVTAREIDVYPMVYGEIALEARWTHDSSVLALCEADGGVLCLVNVQGQASRMRYEDASALDDFLVSALREFEGVLQQ